MVSPQLSLLKINVIKSLKVYYLLCVALFSFVIVYYYRLKQLENMSFSLLGGGKKEKKINPYLPTLFCWARYANITFFYALASFDPFQIGQTCIPLC